MPKVFNIQWRKKSRQNRKHDHLLSSCNELQWECWMEFLINL